jgi:hypothetical protein
MSLGLGLGGRFGWGVDSSWWARLDNEEKRFDLVFAAFWALKLGLLLTFFLLVTNSQSPCRSLVPSSMLVIFPLNADKSF